MHVFVCLGTGRIDGNGGWSGAGFVCAGSRSAHALFAWAHGEGADASCDGGVGWSNVINVNVIFPMSFFPCHFSHVIFPMSFFLVRLATLGGTGGWPWGPAVAYKWTQVHSERPAACC